MARKYTRKALYNLKDFLDDNLSTFVTTANTNNSTSIVEPKYFHVGVSKTRKYPRIEILPNVNEHDYGFEEVPLTDPWLNYNVAILITHSNNNLQVVEDTLFIYDEAMNLLIEDDNTLGGLFVDAQLGDVDYSTIMENEETRTMLQQLLVPLILKSI